MSPREEAVAYLNQELQRVRSQGLIRQMEPIIERLIENADYLGNVFDKIFSPALHEYDRKKIMDCFIIATVFANPDRTKTIRDARKRLPGLIEKFRAKSAELSELLIEVRRAAERAELDLPLWMYGAGEYLSEETKRNSVRYKNRMLLQMQIRSHLDDDAPMFETRPSLQEMLEQLGQSSMDHINPKWGFVESAVATRQHSTKDYMAALDKALDERFNEQRVYNAMTPAAEAVFKSITNTDLAQLGTVLLGLEQEINPDSASPRKLRKRLNPDT